VTLPKNITLTGIDENILVPIVNQFIRGSFTQEHINLLRKITSLPRAYHSPLLEMFLKKPSAVTKNADAIYQLEKIGYYYFPKGNQLLVKGDSRYALLIDFIDCDKARCRSVYCNIVANELPSWISAEKVNYPAFDVFIITSKTAEIAERAIRKLGLPYNKIGAIIKLIAHFKRKQEELFKKLERGLSPQELSDLTKKVNERKATAERLEKYREEAEKLKEPVFFEDTKELLLYPHNYIVDLSDDTPTIKWVGFRHSTLGEDAELGRYILKRKWSKKVSCGQVELESFVTFSSFNEILGLVEQFIPKVPEPYSARLSKLYATLLAYALKKK